jgi:branched-chain amino acid transport system substrate-binding protein
MNKAPDFVLESIAGTDNDYWRRAAHDYRLFRRIETPAGLVSLVELVREKKWIRRGVYGQTRAPFFAHPDVPMMQRFVENYRARKGSYPSDWAVMSYDGVHAIRQGVEKAGSIETERVKDALKGLAIETTRGRLAFREIDNQLSASVYLGRVADDPRYDFPIYADLAEFKGPDIWRPEAEILEARKPEARK